MAAAKKVRPAIFVLAGANGAGKSSIGGEMFRAAGANYYNPDEETRRLRDDFGQSEAAANSIAWHIGRSLLERAILTGTTFAFETTLSGNTMPALIAKAAASGMAVKIWFCGLDSAELHILRVRQRVARGGHDIPAQKIRERFDLSRERLIELLPVVAELKVYDNSAESSNADANMPRPRLLLHTKNGVIQNRTVLGSSPTWAKPIVTAAIAIHRRRSSK